MRLEKPKAAAIILPGAVAKGAFEAGALEVLASSNIPVRRIVATSSGALNGTMFAAGVRARDEQQAAKRLADVWRDEATWWQAFEFHFKDLFDERGLSDQTKLLKLLRRHVLPCQTADRAPIGLDIVVAAANGVLGQIGEQPATTYEKVLGFADSDFDSETGLERVFNAAAASSSFPGVFVPTEVPGVGPCLDGGVVNNAPIKYALRGQGGDEVDSIFVISPTPLVDGRLPELRGSALISHLVEVLVNERLYRNLDGAAKTNAAIHRLEALRGTVLDDAQLAAVKEAIGWSETRAIDIVQIRPAHALGGDNFSALFHPSMRSAYLVAGKEAAVAVLKERQWL